MHTLISFIQTVAAQVVACYLCSWIDGKIGKGSKHEKKPPGTPNTGGFAFGLNPLRTLISLPTLIICKSQSGAKNLTLALRESWQTRRV